ncbi:SDO1-like protein C21C3.19 [Aspergillus awamori]|uniref:SDO1-like protein C21C3.19 n=1 Tax=Aspergillus awamori TaxID=105351 RepID=A0A401L1V0_ASPAW|nr:SDO1-like protein C21C3.19 [Aspergillus awamori]
MVEDATAVQEWRQDHSIPLAQVLDGWKIFTAEHGPQGIHNEASNATLENEFGTSNGDEAILKILDQGEIQENVVSKSLSPKYLALDQHMPNHWS